MDGSIPRVEIERLVRLALREDIGRGDVTCRILPLSGRHVEGPIIMREPGIVCGLHVASEVLRQVDPGAVLQAKAEDGARIGAGDLVATVSGRAASILSAERVMLNFLQRLSGIATLTSSFVERVSGTEARILDTRKTTPGLRLLEKHAVRTGGGLNHRFGLDDGVMIKDNHIAAMGGIVSAVRSARAAAPPLLRVCVEVEDEAGLEEALSAGADHVMLDNFTPERLSSAMALCRFRGDAVTTEASGRVSLENVRAFAETGVDFISVGALTHSARAIDMALDLELLGGPHGA